MGSGLCLRVPKGHKLYSLMNLMYGGRGFMCFSVFVQMLIKKIK